MSEIAKLSRYTCACGETIRFNLVDRIGTWKGPFIEVQHGRIPVQFMVVRMDRDAKVSAGILLSSLNRHLESAEASRLGVIGKDCELKWEM